LLVPVSRGISRSPDPTAAARALRDEINVARDAALTAVAAAGAVGGAGGATSGALAAGGDAKLLLHQEAFIRVAISQRALQFGSFTLKSGRTSPYFFNAGLFATGGALGGLAGAYARAIETAEARGLAFDALFGPAYKGIPLVATVAVALACPPPPGVARDVPFAYNRKEAKDHGEVRGSDRFLGMDGLAVRRRVAHATTGGAVRTIDRASIDRSYCFLFVLTCNDTALSPTHPAHPTPLLPRILACPHRGARSSARR
jgi:hypothetical protein